MALIDTLKEIKLTRKDFISPYNIRWCPGCGDYAILNSLQKGFADLGIPKENFVVVSGIGCSSRFPYYMDTYGFHTIHGRAPTVATGVKVSNPDLSVWVVTGDGDGLSIGGNHLLHMIRRNLDVNILLFNNRIYGLTKGQYSPTSELGKKTKSSPQGSIDQPINPLCFALTAESTFVARTMDTNPKHMIETFRAAAKHKGTSFVEILQNCVIFNNQSWGEISGREVREDQLLMLEHDKPLIFGKEKNKGIIIKGLKPEIVTIGENGITIDDILIHNAHDPDPTYAYLLTQMKYPQFPTPMGEFRGVPGQPTYDDLLVDQMKSAVKEYGEGSLETILKGIGYWEVKAPKEAPSTAPDRRLKTSDIVKDELKIMSEQSKRKKMAKQDPLQAALRTQLRDLGDLYIDHKPLSVDKSTSIKDILLPMERDSKVFVLVKENNQLVGTLSTRELLHKVGTKKNIDRILVGDVMSTVIDTVEPWNTIGDTINKLSLAGIRYIPLKSESDICCVISLKNLLSFIYDQTH